MTELKNLLITDYRKYLSIEDELIKELNSLPRGFVYEKRLNGKIYFINEYTINGERHSATVKPDEVYIIKQAAYRRKYIKEQLGLIKAYKNFMNKKFPDIITLYQSEDEHNTIQKITPIDEAFPDNINNNKLFRTLKGDMVRSKSEVIINNSLFTNGKRFIYEKPLVIGKYTFHPDFTIFNENDEIIFYWEHCGMMHDKNYVNKWNWKKSIYEKYNIFEWKNLIITYENNDDLIDSKKIQKIIDLLL